MMVESMWFVLHNPIKSYLGGCITTPLTYAFVYVSLPPPTVRPRTWVVHRDILYRVTWVVYVDWLVIERAQGDRETRPAPPPRLKLIRLNVIMHHQGTYSYPPIYTPLVKTILLNERMMRQRGIDPRVLCVSREMKGYGGRRERA